MRIALIVSHYHAFVTDGLEAGARTALTEAGMADGDVETFHVPGSFELAQAARLIAQTGSFSAIACLGCLIRGETPHFDYISRATADAIMRAAEHTGVPVTFGVLTTNTAEEALARAGEGPSNKGREAATAALEMAHLYDRIKERARGGEHGPAPIKNARRGAKGPPQASAPGGVVGPPPIKK